MDPAQFILIHTGSQVTFADVEGYFAERDDRRRARSRAIDRLAHGLTRRLVIARKSSRTGGNRRHTAVVKSFARPATHRVSSHQR